MSNKSDSLITLVLGLGLGAVAGILLAPDKGENTRKKIAKSTGEFADETRKKVDEVSKDLSKKGSELKEEITKKSAELKEEITKKAHELKQELEKHAETIKTKVAKKKADDGQDVESVPSENHAVEEKA